MESLFEKINSEGIKHAKYDNKKVNVTVFTKKGNEYFCDRNFLIYHDITYSFKIDDNNTMIHNTGKWVISKKELVE